MSGPYVIRFRGELYWRPNSCGYTSELLEAGLYGEEDARQAERCRPDDKAVLLSAVVKSLSISEEMKRAVLSALAERRGS